MTLKKLVLNRILEEWRFQWRVLHTVMDWTIQLYFLVPVLIIFPVVYLDVWRNLPAYWPPSVPFFVWLVLILLLSCRGNFRTYLQKADLLQLIQVKKLIYGLKVWGFAVSLSYSFVRLLVIFFISLPILILGYQLTFAEITWLFLSIIAFQWGVFTLKKVIDLVIWKWALIAVVILLFALLITQINLMWSGILSIGICLFLIYLHTFKLLTHQRWFLKEVAIEQAERNKLIKLILHFSTSLEKESKFLSRKPILLFRNSKRVFRKRTQVNGLTEILLKSLLRHRAYFRSYSQLLFITATALLLSPGWVKWPVYFLFAFYINYWLKVLLRKMSASAFFEIVPIQANILEEAHKRLRHLLADPFILLFGIILLVQLIMK